MTGGVAGAEDSLGVAVGAPQPASRTRRVKRRARLRRVTLGHLTGGTRTRQQTDVRAQPNRVSIVRPALDPDGRGLTPVAGCAATSRRAATTPTQYVTRIEQLVGGDSP